MSMREGEMRELIISKANEKQPKLSEDTEYNSSYPLEWEGFFPLFSPLSPGRD